MNIITPTIWLNETAVEAGDFYNSVFTNSEITKTDYYTEAGKADHGHNKGDVLTVAITIEGQPMLLLNGGATFQPTPAISFTIQCESVDEINELWAGLSDGGKVLMPLDRYPYSERYGWIQDKYGVSWQLNVVTEPIIQKVIPSLLFTQKVNGQAEDAIDFYTAVFPDSAVKAIARYEADQGSQKEGMVSYGEFMLSGYTMIAMDGGTEHEFTFTPGISLIVECESQDEIDHYWEALSAVPEAEVCGWLQDQYGVSWQIVPSRLNQMLHEGSEAQREHVTDVFMKMKKFNIAELEKAYAES